ncbi:MAG TPA: MaoC family dehydratase [Steroidobacteraceae bacterium]|nr:MaoC family dehydratase [Steroidobacteraceae bacterium]
MTNAPGSPHAQQALFIDDLKVGDRFTSGEHRIDAEQIREFAQQYDPQVFHLDAEAAKRTFFGELVASGWHTAAISMRLLVDGGMPIAGGLIGAGTSLEWPNPTRPGDVLHVESEVLAINPSRSRPDRGSVRVRSRTLNQRGEPVQIAETKVVAFRRPASR